MTELYREAAEILGLEADEYCFAYTTDDNGYGYSYDEPATPIVLAHLICEKEGWYWRPWEDHWRLFDNKNGGGIIGENERDTDAVIRAFVEKYGKKKDELPGLNDDMFIFDMDDTNQQIGALIKISHKLVAHIKSLSERMDKMEGNKNKSDNSKKLCYEGINIKEVIDIHGETVRVANSDTVDKAVYPLYDAIKDINNRIDKWERVNGS